MKFVTIVSQFTNLLFTFTPSFITITIRGTNVIKQTADSYENSHSPENTEKLIYVSKALYFLTLRPFRVIPRVEVFL